MSVANNYKSESIVVEAPMSFTGSAKRIWKITQTDNVALKWVLLVPTALLLISCVWGLVILWYMIFGIFLIPYRLIRRSGRSNKRDKLRHREILENLERR